MLDSGFGIPFSPKSQNSAHTQDDSTRRCIWISQEDLTPNNLEQIKDLLKSEEAPLKYWLLLAFSYKSLGHLESLDSLLKDAEAIFDSKEDSNHLKGTLYSSLGFHNLCQAYQFKYDDERHKRYMDWTNHYLRKTEGTSLYHFYLVKGHQSVFNYMRDKNTDHLATARSMFNMAIDLSHSAILPLVLFGNVMVLSSNYQVASVYYLRALLTASYYLSILENLPESRGFLRERSLELSLAHSQLVWLKAVLFFALSASQFSLGNIESAKSLIERSIALKPLAVSYRFASAIAAYQLTHFKEEFEEEDVPSLLEQYTKARLASHILDRNNPSAQLDVCEFLFHRGDLEECTRTLLELQKTNLSYNLRAELEYQLGRVEHAKRSYSEALNRYMNALSHKNDFVSARLQLVKAAAGCGDLGLAREHCDFLLQCLQKVAVVLKVSAYVYLRSARETLETNKWDMLKMQSVNRSQNQLDISCTFHSVQQGMGRLIDERLFKALSLLEDLLFSSHGIESTKNGEEMSKFTNRFDAKSKMERDLSDPLAMEYYIRCLEILVSRGREYLCPSLNEYYCEYFNLYKSDNDRFKNNFGVILMYTRNYTRACAVLHELNEKLSKDAEGSAGSEGAESSESSLRERMVRTTLALTVRFNYALALEFSGQIAKAQKIYSSLTREYPRYTSAWLRRSIIAFQKCDYESTVRYLEQVKKIHPNSCEPYLLRSYQLGKLKSFDEAIQEIRKMFRSIPSSAYDPYANTLLSSLLIKKSYRIAQSTGAPLVFPKEAMQYAKTALKRPSVCNFYAANCIAVILALEKNFKASYESFLLLMESLSMTSHMKLLVNKNIGILSAAITLAMLGTNRKPDKNKFNKLKVAKTQQHFQSAISNGKMDKSLYVCYIRFLFDVQKYEECIAVLETARLIFQDDIFLYNQIIVTDAMVCSYLRDADKTSSLVEMITMLSCCRFVTNSAEYLLEESQRGNTQFSTESYNKLKQITTRVETKMIPHITSTLPQLEKTCENKQQAREKRLQLQLSIQQAHEAKKREQEQERLRAAEAEEELSEKLLKEASEIASELLTAKPTQT
ncbi:hypothetical protein MACJ_000063 [Theileria orientalis]|uniref:RNA polymerase-associated protein n=1 Tax=Theileria orientalis TaxID=68886 RepID=A0A976QPL0_THEOR|nr:hypothetical protein MACJ_000063 [Theileria orientalis]